MRNLILLLFPLVLFSCSPDKNKIYEWRGENRKGIYHETDLLKAWPDSGLEEIWAIDSLGNGFGSPVFAGEQFFISGEIDSMAVLHCYDLEGDKLWRIR